MGEVGAECLLRLRASKRTSGPILIAIAACACLATILSQGTGPNAFTVAQALGARPASSSVHYGDPAPPALRGHRAGAGASGGAGAEDQRRRAAPWGSCAAGLGMALAAVALATDRRSLTGKQCHSKVSIVGRGASVMDEVGIAEGLDEFYDMPSGADALVKKNSVLVLGATGTLGRQVVRQFLNAGYSVRCIIRNRVDRQFSFLVDWGANCVEGSLARPESLPSALIGIHMVIDCSTARPEESIYDIDWEGKKRFIQCCEAMNIQRYIFMSIKDCDKFPNVPLMKIKYLTEQFLAKSTLRTTILRMSGFFQPLISLYAVPTLESKEVWGDDGSSPGIAYIDSQDAARMVAAAASKERTIGKTLLISGPKIWKQAEVIDLCESLSGKKADVNSVSSPVLKITQGLAGCFQWSLDISERLRFVEVSTGSEVQDGGLMDQETYRLLGLDPENTRDLQTYVAEYYRRVMKMLTVGRYTPDEGEVEKQRAEDETLQRIAFSADGDELPPGQPAEKDVSIVDQREVSDKLQKYFEDLQIEKLESSDNKWFGLSPVAEIVNGRSAMFGISLGVFTEWATDVSIFKQVQELQDAFSAPS